MKSKAAACSDDEETLLHMNNRMTDGCSPASTLVERHTAKKPGALGRANGFVRTPPQKLSRPTAARMAGRGGKPGGPGNAKPPRRSKSTELQDHVVATGSTRGEETRQEILDGINALGSHLSRSVVDFLIDELEKKMIADLAAGMGGIGDEGDDKSAISMSDSSSSSSSSCSSSSSSSSSSDGDDESLSFQADDSDGETDPPVVGGFHDSMARLGVKPIRGNALAAAPPIGMLFVGRNDSDSDEEDDHEEDSILKLPIPVLKFPSSADVTAPSIHSATYGCQGVINDADWPESKTTPATNLSESVSEKAAHPKHKMPTTKTDLEASMKRFDSSDSNLLPMDNAIKPVRRQGSDRCLQIEPEHDCNNITPSEMVAHKTQKRKSQRTNLGGSVRDMNVSMSILESLKARPDLRHHSQSVRNVKLHAFMEDGKDNNNELSMSAINVSIVDEPNISFPKMHDECVKHIVECISTELPPELKKALQSPPLFPRPEENPQDQDACGVFETTRSTIAEETTRECRPKSVGKTSEDNICPVVSDPNHEAPIDPASATTTAGNDDTADEVMDDLIALSIDPQAEAERVTRLKQFMPRSRSANHTSIRKEVVQKSDPQPGVPRSKSDKTRVRPGVQRACSGAGTQRFLERKNSGQLMRLARRNNSGNFNGAERTPSFQKMAIVRTSSHSSSKRVVQRKKSMDGMKRAVERINSKSEHSTVSNQSGRRVPLRRKFSFGRQCRSAPSSSYGVFAGDTVRDKASHERRTTQRRFSSQKSMRRLMITKSASSRSLGASSHHGIKADSKKSTLLETFPLPCGVKHQCALLFVDISGFTKLSTMMKVEQLSKTINDYFQMIVEEVIAYGGDILKFAGDAIFAEWRSTASTRLDPNLDDDLGCTSGGVGLGPEKAVLTAAECAARVTEKCGNHPVYGEDGERLATLNLHCAIGFGEVVGVHLGNADRLEYFIIGDPIQQVAAAMEMGKIGTVVASPECLEIIYGVPSKIPKAILSDSAFFANPKPHLVNRKSSNGDSDENVFSDRLHHWDLASLRDMKNLMSLYAHPVVAANPQAAFVGKNKAAHADAELRDVFTVFIQPHVSVELSGDVEKDKNVLKVLHDIFVIVNTQLRRFKGQLRQYILDDKGLVLIANFGLRGSTFPQMVERLAMPFAANVQPVLKSKLGVECKMGATYGKAYVGVIGGVFRHEYSVLGASVNLAARLMASKSNKGFLVDEAVKRKALNREFEGLAPVKAKGYSEPVPIYEPALSHRSSWGSEGIAFVGRKKELENILEVAKDVIDVGNSAKMVLVSAEGGSGKTSLLAQATGKIQDFCVENSATHLILCHVCSEADSFQPLSAVGPLLLDVLSFVRRSINEEGYLAPPGFARITELAPAGKESAPSVMVGACRDAEVPDKYIYLICHLLLDNSWPAHMDDAAQNRESHEVARFIVSIFMKCTIHLDLILWAVDDIPHADEMSWRVIELLHTHSCNLMLLMASRPVDGADMNIDLGVWNNLHCEGINEGTFVLVEFAGLGQEDFDTLVDNLAENCEPKWEGNTKELAKDVFVQSGGIPQLALQILKKKLSSSTKQHSGPSETTKTPKSRAKRKKTLGGVGLRGLRGLTRQGSWTSTSTASSATDNMADVGEHLLHKMDLLSPDVRGYLNLGALLGPSFDTRDIISVMERYKRIPEARKQAHADSIRSSLEEAVQCGILEDDLADHESSFCFQGMDSEDVTYRFSHANWRKILLKTVLNSWKRAMLRLVAESLEAMFDAHDSNHNRAIKQLFSHFKGGKRAGKNLLVASELALKIGEKMVKNGLCECSKKIYEKALELWLAPGKEEHFVLKFEFDGLSKPRKTIEFEPEEIEYIAMLYIALGRCCLLLLDKDESFEAFQRCLDLLSKSQHLEDVSLLFTAYCGRFHSLRLSQKGELKNEQTLVEDLVCDASHHENIIHVLQAMAVQAELLARHGDFYEGIDMCSELRNVYDPCLHSGPLLQVYAEDKCIQIIALSAGWHAHVSHQSEAKEVCDFVLSNMMNLATLDSHSLFITLFPVVCIMKDYQDSVVRTRDVFLEHVVRNEDTSASNAFGDILEHILMLLDLAVDKSLSKNRSAKKILAWALGKGGKPGGRALNTYTGNLGLSADAVAAELCLELSTFPFPNAVEESTKMKLTERAAVLIKTALESSDESGVSYARVVSLAGRHGITGDKTHSDAAGPLTNILTFE